jgi:hypothetical protein
MHKHYPAILPGGPEEKHQMSEVIAAEHGLGLCTSTIPLLCLEDLRKTIRDSCRDSDIQNEYNICFENSVTIQS